ncbi:MAG: hypothetical protein FJ222_06960 [Lentisphaerae bacterium]|nr:hypothetical protein [Lentisphaerota bacterium]
MLYAADAEIARFEASARAADGEVRVSWQTTAELGVGAFRVMRQRPDQAPEPVGSGYVRARGDEAGGSYELADPLARAGDSVRYDLLIVSRHGADQPVAAWEGLIQTAAAPRKVPSATLASVIGTQALAADAPPPKSWIGTGDRVRAWTNSVPADRVRLSLRHEGLYRVTAQELATAGGWNAAAVAAAIAGTNLALAC